MFNILMSWEKLKAYFTSAEIAQSQFDTKFKAILLTEMLSDYKNYLFLEFTTPVVQEFERLNSIFQQTKADLHELYQQIFLHQKSLQNRLYDAIRQNKIMHQVDFGVRFLTACSEFLQQNNSAEAHLEKVKERCMSMPEEALSQVTCRLLFESLSELSSVIILNQISRPMCSELPFIHHAGNNNSKIEEQYRQMPFVDGKEEAPFKKDGLPVDTEQFWSGVLQHRVFKELATFALTCLVTPVSDAVLERIFSLVSSVKTKTRNRMQLSLLDAMVRVRAEVLLSSKCCKEFIASSEMLKTSHRTRFMVYVPLIPVGRLVITWIWSFSCDVSTKNILKFVWFFFLVLLDFIFKCRSGNPAAEM